MKKILSIVFAGVALLAISSCKKEYITNVNGSINKTLYTKTIPSSQWVRTKDGKSDSTSISAPELTSYFNDNGGVLVYMSFFPNVYEQMPEVYEGISYSYYHYTGNIVLYAQPTNGGTPVAPKPMSLKIVLVDSQ